LGTPRRKRSRSKDTKTSEDGRYWIEFDAPSKNENCVGGINVLRNISTEVGKYGGNEEKIVGKPQRDVISKQEKATNVAKTYPWRQLRGTGKSGWVSVRRKPVAFVREIKGC